jgi:hypothetical protein
MHEKNDVIEAFHHGGTMRGKAKANGCVGGNEET